MVNGGDTGYGGQTVGGDTDHGVKYKLIFSSTVNYTYLKMLTDFYIGRYLVAIAFTALSYVIGIYIAQHKLKLFGSAIIGFAVVTIGYLSALLQFSILLIILMPIPFGFIILYFISGRNIKKTLYSYAIAWVAYIIFHVILSSLFHFHSLIPSWKLSD